MGGNVDFRDCSQNFFAPAQARHFLTETWVVQNKTSEPKTWLLRMTERTAKMRHLDGSKTKVVLFGVVLGVLASGGSVTADFTFGTPTNVGAPVSTPADDANPHTSPDGLALYFSSGRSGGSGGHDLYVSRRETADAQWQTPVNLGPTVNSPVDDWAPSLSPDGLELFFTSKRPGGLGGFSDIWLTTRATPEDDWGEPEPLGPNINTPDFEGHPSISSDGLELYFCTWTTNARPGLGSSDIWVTSRLTLSAPWGSPTNLGPTVNSSSYDGEPDISADRLCLIFGSDRPGGSGGSDIWMTTRRRKEDPWGTPVNLGPAVNSLGNDTMADISDDSSVLFFASDRSGSSAIFDVWQAPVIPIVDFNGDGKVDGTEVRALADRWGTDDTLYDIGPMPWGDGIVDVGDLKVLARYIGEPVDDPTLVAHWKLDETDGTTAYDSIGRHHGTVIGVPVWWPEGGRVDGALELSGTAFIMASFVLNPADGPFSVLAWVKGGQPGQGIIAQQGGVDWLHVDAAQGNLTTELSRSLCSQTVITDGDWHRVGVTWDGSACQLYVDDVLEAKSTEADLASSTGGIVIGCRKTVAGTFFTGLIDDVRIYSREVKP
jgi:Tol biopolymer transport system component